jgi:phage gp29-like protein
LRSFEYGTRQTYCDLLTELIEGDPHAHAVLKKCFANISNRDYELVPPALDSASDKRNAQVVADDVKRVIDNIPRWRASLYTLLWGHVTGVNASETLWGFDGSWYVKALSSIPSRMIDFDDDFEPYVPAWEGSQSGVKFSDYPGKFIVFAPTVTGELPTREGLGRILVYWLAFKRWGMRDFMSYTERYGKPTPIVTHKTGRDKADEDDVTLAGTLISGIGRGTQPGASIPDTLTVDFANAASGSGGSGSGSDRTVHNALIALCNAEISKAVLGGTLTTEVGSSGGNRALGDRQGEDQEAIQSAIARQLDDVVTSALVYWIVKLNFGDDAADRYCPRYHTKIEQSEDLKSAADVLKILVDAGLEVATADVYERFGYRMPTKGEDVLKAKPAPKPPAVVAEPDSEDEDDNDTEDGGPAQDPAAEDDAPDGDDQE